MHALRISREKTILIAAFATLTSFGCTAQTSSEVADPVGGKADDPACEGATLDHGGYCRRPNGHFASWLCCEREYLAECIAETEECLGHIEDESYAESCGVNQSDSMCVSETHCPAYVFEDPERTPHEILGVDISTQCQYVCEEYFPDCMWDRGYDTEYDYAGAFDACVSDSGCPSDLCEADPELCERGRARFQEVRDGLPEPTEPTEPTEPEMWTLEQCASEAEECLGHTEDETYLDACGDDLDTSVCINEESCPSEVFSDPERTPLEVLGLDISEQCTYVCENYLPDCMYEAGWDEDTTLAGAFATCIDDSGCTSDICDTDRALCDDAASRFASARE